MNNFLAVLELCAFASSIYPKFTGINFRGRTNVKYLMQTQTVSSLPLLKITTKSTHFFSAKKKIPMQKV